MTGALLSASTTMKELLAAYPGAQRALFRKYHIGGCASCGFSPEETLGEVCQRSGEIDPGDALRWVEECDGLDRANEVTPAELAELRGSGVPLRLLDIRTREEWETVRIQGAVFFTQDIMQEVLMKWPKDEMVVIYDHQGKRSLDAAAYFLGQGFTVVKSLRGGIDAWAAQIDPDMARYEVE